MSWAPGVSQPASLRPTGCSFSPLPNAALSHVELGKGGPSTQEHHSEEDQQREEGVPTKNRGAGESAHGECNYISWNPA